MQGLPHARSPRRTGAVALAALLLASALALPAAGGTRVTEAQGNQPKDVAFRLADPSTYSFTEYGLPESRTNPSPEGRAHSITVAPDGKVWYSGLVQHNLGMFDPATETFKLFDTPTRQSRPHGIQAAPDGMIWLTETGIPQNKMARFDPATELFTEYLLPRANPYPHTVWIARGGDVFFTYEYGDGIGRIDRERQRVTDFPVPTKRSRPYGIQEGPDGNIWVVEFLGNKIARLNPATGEVREWEHPDRANDPGTRRLAVDSQSRVWFVEHEIGALGRFDARTESWARWWMPRLDPSARRDQAYALNFDSKGQLWVNNFGGNYLARFDEPTESWVVYPYPSPRTTCRLMAFDRDDVLWCASSATPVLVRFQER